jgi:gamma-glutamylcysteine synthetase
MRNLAEFEERRVGLEFENPVIDATGNPASSASMQEVWSDFASSGWQVGRDSDSQTIISAEKDFGHGTVALTSDCAACNLEMALPPCQTISEAGALYARVTAEVLPVLAARGLSLLAYGIQPGAFADVDEARTPSTHYQALERAGSGNRFTNAIMLANSAHQVGVGIRVREAVEVTNELLKITGLVVALCGNSPIHGWEILPWKEWRILGWDFRFIVDTPGFEKLTQFPSRPFRTLADYYSYYWDTPSMILVPLREGRWILPDEELTYGEYFSKSRVTARDLGGEARDLTPEPHDFNVVSVREFFDSLRDDTLEDYLEGRLSNCYVEYRGGAASPRGEELALPSLILGLVNNLAALKQIGRRHAWKQWGELIYEAAARGLDARIDGQSVVPLLKALIETAAEGLSNRPYGEGAHLDALRERLARRRNPADTAVEAFRRGRENFLRRVRY